MSSFDGIISPGKVKGEAMYHSWFELHMVAKQAQKDLHRWAEEARRAEAARRIEKERRKEKQRGRIDRKVPEGGSDSAGAASAA